MAEPEVEIEEIPKELPPWVITQKKTFVRWANSHLRKKNAVMENIDGGFADGLNLMILINVLYDVPIPRFNKNAKMRAHQLDNVSLAIQMVEQAGVKLHFVKPINILDKDLKLTLGMTWTIIHHYQISGISVEDLSAKEGLLLWCQRKTKGYKGVDVQNFSTSWRSGLAFAALIHAHRPDLINFDALSNSTPEEVVRLAFDVADKELGIPQLLDVEDVCTERPDEKSVMTQVSEYFHRFAAQSEQETAGRRLNNFLTFSQQRDEMIAHYLAEATKLINWAEHKTSDLESNKSVDDDNIDYPAARRALSDFYSYKSTEKPAYNVVKVQAENIFSNLQTKLLAFGRPAYIPPAGLAPNDINDVWFRLSSTETGHLEKLQENLKKVKENLRKVFAKHAEGFAQWVADKQAAVNVVSGSLDDQISQLKALEAEIATGQSQLENINSINTKLVEAGIHDNPYTEYSVEELTLLYDEAKTVLKNKREFVDNLLARQREKERLAAELAAIERAKEALRVEFAEKANAFVPWAKTLRDRLDTKGDLEEQTRQVKTVQEEASHGKTRLSELEEVDRKLREYNVLDNKHTTFTLGELELIFSDLTSSTTNKLALIESQIARRQERQRNKNAIEQVLASNDALKRAFASKASDFATFIEANRNAFTKLSGDLRVQQNAVVQAISSLEEATGSVNELEGLNQQMLNAGIDVNEHTTHTFEELKATYNELVLNAKRKLAFLENQITAVELQRIPDSQLEEYKNSFKTFDKDGSGRLQKKEFQAAMQSIGYRLSDEELNAILQAYKDPNNPEQEAGISFDDYVAFMIERNQDKDTPDQVRGAFKLLAKDKDSIVPSDLAPYLPADRVEWLVNNAPKKADGSIDFEQFVSSNFGK